jgi:hypothetical protein
MLGLRSWMLLLASCNQRDQKVAEKTTKNDQKRKLIPTRKKFLEE